ncbi:MAG: hypothetical protein ABL949_01235 [Fimbriimonadaceae bacterium]
MRDLHPDYNSATGDLIGKSKPSAGDRMARETRRCSKFCIYVEPGLEFYDGFWSMAAVDDGLRMTLSATLDVQLELEDRAVALLIEFLETTRKQALEVAGIQHERLVLSWLGDELKAVAIDEEQGTVELLLTKFDAQGLLKWLRSWF